MMQTKNHLNSSARRHKLSHILNIWQCDAWVVVQIFLLLKMSNNFDLCFSLCQVMLMALRLKEITVKVQFEPQHLYNSAV